MKEPVVRKWVGISFRLAAIVFLCLAWFVFDEPNTVMHLKMMLGFVTLAYLGHTIFPMAGSPWEPDYQKLWKE